MRNNLLSIIVPVYNVEQYLVKCIESILEQTYKNFELILVDDGSPDNSGKICDSYAKNNDNIIVIHKDNGGLSSARNAGLDIAKGYYIGFVDSDDWIEPTMYEEMINCMEIHNCDLVECGINLIYNRGIDPYYYESTKIELMSGRVALKRQLNIFGRTDHTIPRIAVWSKLFKASFWKGRQFPEGKIHEDYMLTCQALYEAKRVGIVHHGLLNHLTCNPNSIVNTKFSKRDLYKEVQLRLRMDYLLRNNDKELYELAKADYYDYLPSVVWRSHINDMPTEAVEYLKQIKLEKKIIKETILPTKRRMEYFMLFYIPKFYLWLRQQKSKINGK